jgi:molybdate transport repressor ModE-like protein
MNIFVKGTFSIELETGLKINPRIFTLLQLVEETGSLSTAAKKIGLSYSHAWNTLYKINCQLNAPVITTQRGGKGGGVAKLTARGIDLLRQYEEICEDFADFLRTHRIKI